METSRISLGRSSSCCCVSANPHRNPFPGSFKHGGFHRSLEYLPGAPLLAILHERTRLDSDLCCCSSNRRTYLQSFHARYDYPLHKSYIGGVHQSRVFRCCTFASHARANQVWSCVAYGAGHVLFSVFIHLHIWGVLGLPFLTHRALDSAHFGAYFL